MSENVCNKFATSKDNYKCIYDRQSCLEMPSSECVDTYTIDTRRLSALEITNEECKSLKTSDKYNYKCIANEAKNRCLEYLIDSECTKTYYSPSKFTKEDCKELETSDKKYKCVPSSDQTYCVQSDSIVINRFNLLLLTLCLLSLF